MPLGLIPLVLVGGILALLLKSGEPVGLEVLGLLAALLGDLLIVVFLPAALLPVVFLLAVFLMGTPYLVRG